MAKRTPAPVQAAAKPAARRKPSPSLQARQAVKPPVKRNLPAKTTNHMSNKQAGSKPAARPLGLDGKELEIKINLDKLTFGDLEMALDYEDGKTPVKELLPFLNRVVVGGVKHIPLNAMPAIMDALSDALAGMGNPKN